MGTTGKVRLSSKAYAEIRQLIVSLQLKPGEQIEEGTLEEKLSIGRTPIREALQRLTMEKLLDLIPGRGFLVRPISIDDVKSLFEAMTAFEQIIVQFTAQRIQNSDLEKLERISSNHKDALAKKDFLKVALHNTEFHKTFNEATGNMFLVASMDGLIHQSERLAYLTHTKEAHPTDGVDYDTLAVNDHDNLIISFRKGDGEEAMDIIKAHCHRFFLRVCHYMEPRLGAASSRIPNPGERDKCLGELF